MCVHIRMHAHTYIFGIMRSINKSHLFCVTFSFSLGIKGLYYDLVLTGVSGIDRRRQNKTKKFRIM